LYSEYVHLLTINKETDEELMQKYEEEVQKAKALESDVVRMAVERSELQDLQEQLEIEQAERVEYEKNVDSMVDFLVNEKMNAFRAQMEAGFDSMMEKMKKNLKEPPADLNSILEL
jgi:hypothetical protein